MDATPQASVAAGLLRVGQSALFVALLLIGLARGVLAGAGWPLYAASGAVAVLFGAGLLAHRRIGDTGRAVWVVGLLLGTVALMQVSPDFVWLAFPVWMWLAHLLPLPAYPRPPFWLRV